MNPWPTAEPDLSGTITRLFVYPVKSCAGVEVREALLTDAGLELDRAWMVVDSDGRFLSQRSLPRMALIHPHIKLHEVVLRAPGMLALHLDLCAAGRTAEVTIWRDRVPAWDMGDLAARWLSDFLGQPCRLVRFNPQHRRLSAPEWTGGVEAPNQFSDGFPVLVVGEASLHDLNQRLVSAGHAPVGVERFRPNVVIGGVHAHDEDRIDTLSVWGGAAALRDGREAVQLQLVKPCPRCPIPDIDPTTALSDPAVGDTLRTYRQDRRLQGAITFGMNAIVRQGAGRVLQVGQPVTADIRFD